MAAPGVPLAFAVIRTLEETPAVLRSILAGASQEDLDWQPSPERWSIAMVLAHLFEAEQNVFLRRLTLIAGQDNPDLPIYDQMEMFKTRSAFDARRELDNFQRERRRTVDWLRGVPESAAARTGRHAELGVITFSEVLHELAFHDLGHIRQIAELYRSHAFYPKIGGFQRYYAIHP